MANNINKMICGAYNLKHRLTEKHLLSHSRNKHEDLYLIIDENPLISLIIATYNRGKILTERTIPSILNQTYQNFEIVIIGDRCIDDTPELIKKINDHRVRFFDLPQRGNYPKDPLDRWFVQGVAPRNKGLQLAKGKWLAWMSDDDVLLPNYFDTLLRFAQKGSFEFVSASYTCVKNGDTILRRPTDYDPPIGGMPAWMYRSYLNLFKWNIQSWRKSWNRPCDYDLQNRMMSAGVRMGYVDTIVAHLPAVQGTNTVGSEAQIILAAKERSPHVYMLSFL
ncbi:MAG: hypothetical protein C0399_09360 [Syntrophus sp. (in: bacteria)]|nr:hypothetical protein [Syntrophus sp. (in: bacteria)]